MAHESYEPCPKCGSEDTAPITMNFDTCEKLEEGEWGMVQDICYSCNHGFNEDVACGPSGYELY